MPPMADAPQGPQPTGGGMGPQDDAFGPQDNGMDDGPMGDDGDFDGMGPEGEEGNDPKKDIQKATGKLSQDLRTYNDQQDKPDTELNKYVAGMIVKQAAKGMTDSDKKSVINKMNSTGDDSDEDMPMDDDSMDDGQPMDDNASQDKGKEMPMEGKRYIDRLVSEVIGDMLDSKRDRASDRKENRITNDKITKRNPFVANR